jgi:lysozyme
VKFGVDVSRWQGDIDWKRLASQGVLWAGIRASVGDYYIDPRFGENFDESKGVGILPFAYHVVNPDNEVDGQLERYRLALVGRVPVMHIVDAELPGSVSNGVLRRRYCWFTRDGMTEHGGQWVIYTNKSFAETHLKDSYNGWSWSNVPLWVASYGNNDGQQPPSPPYPSMPSQWGEWKAWQYTDNGVLEGTESANIDLNIMDDDFYTNLRVRSGIPEPGEPQPPPPAPVDLEERVGELELQVANIKTWGESFPV